MRRRGRTDGNASALLKRYVAEPDTADATRLLLADPEWVTAGHTVVEVRRNLARRLTETPDLLRRGRQLFDDNWSRTHIVAPDERTCEIAAISPTRPAPRSLDALHLAAAQRVGAPGLRLVTFDGRLSRAARDLGWTVAGA